MKDEQMMRGSLVDIFILSPPELTNCDGTINARWVEYVHYWVGNIDNLLSRKNFKISPAVSGCDCLSESDEEKE